MLNWLIQHSPLLYFTQSIWRDEAFSIFVGEKSLSFILQNLTFEPPVYYILLHFWIRIFGTHEIAIRSLSLMGFTLATIVVIFWSEKLFRNHWLSWVTPLLFFTNPMLVYYAFEIRTYGWYMYFAVLSLYAFSESKWRLWIIATILGFYTHTYFIFLFAAQGIHWLAIHKNKLLKPLALFREPAIVSSILIFTVMIPWILRVLRESATLKHSWYFPVDFNLVKSVLGNMYLGYEGTPWHLWGFTAYLSVVLLGIFFIAVYKKSTRTRNSLFLFSAIIPLAIVIGISFIKPLFVNRYLISVTIAEVFLIAFAIEAVKNRLLQKLVAWCFVLGALAFNVWYPSQHAKLNIRATVQEINVLKGKTDVIFALSPLIFFETQYYSGDRTKVFLYNPHGVPFPWYVGGVLVSTNQMVPDLPVFPPSRAFLVAEDGSFTISYRASAISLAQKIKQGL